MAHYCTPVTVNGKLAVDELLIKGLDFTDCNFNIAGRWEGVIGRPQLCGSLKHLNEGVAFKGKN